MLHERMEDKGEADLEHLIREALSLDPDAERLGHSHALEEKLGGVGAAHAELVELAHTRYACR